MSVYFCYSNKMWLDWDLRLWKRNLMMHINTPNKKAVLVKSSHILWKKNVLWFSLWCPFTALSVCSLLFSKAVATMTRCCSFSLQAAYMLLSGTSVNHRVEAEQSKDIRGKTREHFLCKIWPDFTKISVLWNVVRCIFKYHFLKPQVVMKLHVVALLWDSNVGRTEYLLHHKLKSQL